MPKWLCNNCKYLQVNIIGNIEDYFNENPEGNWFYEYYCAKRKELQPEYKDCEFYEPKRSDNNDR